MDLASFEARKFETRKREHLTHSLDAQAQSHAGRGFQSIALRHDAWPRIDFQQVQLGSESLKTKFGFSSPFYISGMTAGHEAAPSINQQLAVACQNRGWGLGLGSNRRDLSDGASVIESWGRFRAEFPDLSVFANIGMTQLSEISLAKWEEFLSVLRPDALCIHLNALQECVQENGTPNFLASRDSLFRFREYFVDQKIIIKETGCGMSRDTLRSLLNWPIQAIDVSGTGGTHWGHVEGLRAGEGSDAFQTSLALANWGESTVESLLSAELAKLDLLMPQGGPELWASGGLRSGVDAAKSFALGADRAGYALPALKALLENGPNGLARWMSQCEHEASVAIFVSGAQTPGGLRGKWKRI